MFRRLSATALAVALLATAVSVVTAARPEAGIRIGEAQPAEIRLDGKYRGPNVESPFAHIRIDDPELDSVVATADIEVTYNGFTAEAQAAFQVAVDIWERLIYSPRTIQVNANWATLDPGVLGSAGSNGLWTGDGKVWTKALLEAMCNCPLGSEVGAEQYEINANFSSSFSDWYMGTDADPPAGEVDFVSVVLHEIGHGLGFSASGFEYNSGNGEGYWGFDIDFPSNFGLAIYSAPSGGDQLMNTDNYDNPSTELGDALRSNSLYFDGTNVNAQGGRARMYAPAVFAPGSSIHHLNESTYPPGNINSLMTPSIASGEAIHNPGPITMALLRDIGWDAEGCAAAPFPDVPNTHPFCLEIKWMKDNNISTGFGDGMYQPSSNVTRAAMSAFMARLDGGSTPACTSAPFTDVPVAHPFCKEIKWMKDEDISTGFPDGSYQPSANVTRQAMSAFMARLAEATTPACTSPPFTDVPVSHPFCKEIKWMKDNLISTGFADGSYQPNANVSRQAMSAFMFRVNGLL